MVYTAYPMPADHLGGQLHDGRCSRCDCRAWVRANSLVPFNLSRGTTRLLEKGDPCAEPSQRKNTGARLTLPTPFLGSSNQLSSLYFPGQQLIAG
jgi:hypothetical protein